MVKQKNISSSSGIGFIGLLTITFIVLKFLKVITWSWWWVISPLWISISILIIFGIIYYIFALSTKRVKYSS